MNIHTENRRSDSGIRPAIDSILAAFDPITLAEMDSVELMNRIDTKFLASSEQILQILQRAVEHYRVVEIEKLRACPYSSIYFDTEDAAMYTMHHNGKRNRYKIRMRTYESSGISFLEIKRKNNKGRTLKKRTKIEQQEFQCAALKDEGQTFIRRGSPYEYKDLRPCLQNFFCRITLVDKKKTERITIDTNIQFRAAGSPAYIPVENLAIVEMKQDAGAVKSPFRQYLNDLSILPGGMSKYCLGTILTDPRVKNNRFKQKIRYINKLTGSQLATVQ